MFRFNLWTRPFLPGASGQTVEGGPLFPLGMTPGLTLTTPVSTDKNKDKSDVSQVTSYSTAFPLFRPGDTLPLYSPIHQQFLRAQLELAAHNRDSCDHLTHTSAFAQATPKKHDSPSISPRSVRSSPGQPTDVHNTDSRSTSPSDSENRIETGKYRDRSKTHR